MSAVFAVSEAALDLESASTPIGSLGQHEMLDIEGVVDPEGDSHRVEVDVTVGPIVHPTRL